jgi:2-polyprenyl-3-methyl-5-hydroxy-6-metoxy-1,4-benzoquinol methylase
VPATIRSGSSTLQIEEPAPETRRERAPHQPPLELSAAPIIATDRVAACVVCGGATVGECARGYDYELGTCSNEWRFVQCERCRHVWLDPRPSAATLGVIYPPHYYAYEYETRVNAIARRAKALLDGVKLRTIIKALHHQPRTFLDIGCGTGRYLHAMASRGLAKRDIHGLELDQRVVDTLVADGFDVQCARVENASIEERTIDLATMFHVIEHVAGPDRVVSRIASWLAPGGVLAVETPNLDALDRRLFANRYWGGYHIPRHWHLFTEATLARLLRNAGLEPIATMYQTGHTFWMFSVHHWLRYEGRPRPRLARLFDPFSSVVLLAAFKARAAAGRRTSSMLMLARRPS